MGRTADALWYDEVDVSAIQVIVVEWTHGNNEHLVGVDIPILLNSTPEETLAHRRARSRDGAVDSPFTTMVLELEQARLRSRAAGAAIIVARSGELLDYDGYLKAMGADLPAAGTMLNVYPDSIGGTLADLVAFVRRPELKDVFSSAYLLPSVFNTDLDRGFSVIDYGSTTGTRRPMTSPRWPTRASTSSSTSSSTTPRCCRRSSRTSSPRANAPRTPTSSSTGTRSGPATANSPPMATSSRVPS